MPNKARAIAYAGSFLWLAAPLLGRVGPFFYPLLALAALPARSGPRIAGLKGFFLLAAIYTAYVSALALLTAAEGTRVFPSIREALHLLLPAAVAFFAVRMTDAPTWRFVWRGAVLALIATWGAGSLVMLAHGTWQAELLASNPLYLGASVLYPAVICLFPPPEGRTWRILGLLGLLATAHLLTSVTGSRAYFVLFVLIVALRLIAVARARYGTLRSVLGTAALGLALLAGIVALMPDHGKARFAALATIPAIAAELWSVDPAALPEDGSTARFDSSLRVRMAMIVGAVTAYAEAPVFGHGGPQLYSAAAPHMPDAYAQGHDIHHLHNEIANQAVAHGAIGLFLMLAMVVWPVLLAWRLGVLWSPMGGFAALTALASFGIGFGNVLLMADYPAYLFSVNTIGAVLMISAHAARGGPPA